VYLCESAKASEKERKKREKESRNSAKSATRGFYLANLVTVSENNWYKKNYNPDSKIDWKNKFSQYEL